MGTQCVLLALLAAVLVQCAVNAEEIDEVDIVKICRTLLSGGMSGSSSY